MNDVEKVRHRMEKRKGNYKPLNDHNFKLVYNAMIKSMVILVVSIVTVIGIKTNMFANIQNTVLDNKMFQQAVSFVQDTFLDILPSEKSIEVNSEITYQQLGNDYFKNNSNEVVNFEKGKVIAKGNVENKEYVTILFYNDVQVSYMEIENITVNLYQEVDQGTVIGNYDDKFKMKFEKLGKEISYETYIGME